MQRILKFLMLMTLLITLTACSSKKCPKQKIQFIKEFVQVSSIVPNELLQPVPQPSAEVLRKVKITHGKDIFIDYLRALIDAWYQNYMKLKHVGEIINSEPKKIKIDVSDNNLSKKEFR